METLLYAGLYCNFGQTMSSITLLSPLCWSLPAVHWQAWRHGSGDSNCDKKRTTTTVKLSASWWSLDGNHWTTIWTWLCLTMLIMFLLFKKQKQHLPLIFHSVSNVVFCPGLRRQVSFLYCKVEACIQSLRLSCSCPLQGNLAPTPHLVCTSSSLYRHNYLV